MRTCAGVLLAVLILREGAVGRAETPDGPASATAALAERLLGTRAREFQFEAIPADSPEGRPCDVFEFEAGNGAVRVRGSNPVAMATGLHWYLKYHCRASVSWAGNQLDLPSPLPDAPRTRRVCRVPWRYYFNYCTFSYTMAWWDWARWEREIDWMALNGVNMPLSVTGQEAVWQNVLREFGLSDTEIAPFFVGPAYLPFGWMGCMDGWGGPLTQSWIDQHKALQERIVARERELGMKPVLQGFTGHVPPALEKHLEDAKLQQLPSWCGFPGTHFLDPATPAFARVGKAFVEEQTRLFGTDHLYASDTFIEMSPPSGEPEFLANMGKAVYGAMAAADPEAVWVMQGWIFVNNPNFWKPPQARALLGAVPDDRMILLDLFCESDAAWRKTDAFYGKPWVWCIVHNFGGVRGLWGDLNVIGRDPHSALADAQRGELCGMGMMMEGIEQNPIVYDLLMEMPWRAEPPELKTWVRDFAQRRYGAINADAEAAWAILRETVYASSGSPTPAHLKRPSLTACTASSPPYDTVRLLAAWRRLLGAADALGNKETYRYDLVDIGRQFLSNLAGPLAEEIRIAYESGDRKALTETGKRFLSLIDDADRLLATQRAFRLGHWTDAARRWAENGDEARHYEWNARNQITLWGPRDSILHEYARKEWAGLLGSFYRERWERFLDRLGVSLQSSAPFDEESFQKEMMEFEEQWTHGPETFDATPEGDSVAIARELATEYEPVANAYFAPETPSVSLSTGKPASCSSSLPPYPASLANDGLLRNTDRYWATDISQDPEPWWQVDLGEIMRVGRVVVVGYYGDARVYGFLLETSADGVHWETAADWRDNQRVSTRAGHNCEFAPRRARFVRVTQTANSANTGRHLVEVLVFPE